jgi:hypothetical protein
MRSQSGQLRRSTNHDETRDMNIFSVELRFVKAGVMRFVEDTGKAQHAYSLEAKAKSGL